MRARKPLRGLPLLCVVLIWLTPLVSAQFYSHDTEFLRLVYYEKAHEYLVPHLVRSFENSLAFHRQLFHYTPSEPIVILLHDFGDYGHGGTSTVPWNYMSIGIEPFDYVYETMPANERMNWLMHHELVHVVATDKAAGSDNFFRKLFLGKVAPTQENPMSMAYSFLTSPRWYSPRWYHEGIAVFLETWMAGGLGRVLGGYDEMVFRTMVLENAYFYDIVGLESEGTTIDFQVGQNSYLYGTRFVAYLAYRYGPEKVLEWFDRDEGSRRYFSSQFQKVYGVSLDEEWSRWIEWEHRWQRENVAQILEFPATPYRKLYDGLLGSVSRAHYDAAKQLLYAAVNYPGKPAHIVAINLEDGTSKTITEIQSPALYYVSSVAFDPVEEKLFFTTDNTRYFRDLNEVDLKTGQRRTLMKDCRTGDLVVNPADHSIWGVQHHNGLSSLVRFPQPYEGWNTLLTLSYGKDIYDLDISPDGKRISCSLIDVSGRVELVTMETEKLLQGDSSYEVLHEFTNNSPANFVFSPSGRYLYGTSYYTGVSNVWRYDFELGQMDIVSNTDTGFFRPLPLSEEELVVFRFSSTGFVPVQIHAEPLEDVNAVRYLGQQVVEEHPIVKDWNAGSPARVDLDAVTIYQGEYKPLESVRLASMIPVVEGYKDSVSLGMRFNLSDPLGLHNFNVTAGYTPDNDLEDSERFNLKVNWDHFPWHFEGKYNASDFYDLFGPTKASRKGYSGALRYDNYLISERPRTLEYSIAVAGYGGLDTLPDFQNIPSPFDKFLSFGGKLAYSHLRRTIGAVDYERGTRWGVFSRNNVVESDLIPRVYGYYDVGFALPIDHSSLWIRSAGGKSFGDPEQPFANFYFGGFGNNWVDYQEVRRYREYYTFPGIELNEVGGTNFGKVLVEWTLPPIRFQRVGFPAFYTNWTQLALFTSGLASNFNNEADRRGLFNVGAQMDFETVLFSNLESTLSLGYAAAFEGGNRSTEFMVSLKILR